MAENRRILRIVDTRANLQSNLQSKQIAIESDGVEALVYKDDDGTYHIVANKAADFTATRIPFANSTGELADDAALVWLSATKRAGFGVAAPETTVHIRGGENTSNPAADSETFLYIENDGNIRVQISSGTTSTQVIQFGDTDDNDAGYIKYAHTQGFLTLNSENVIEGRFGGLLRFFATASGLSIGDEITFGAFQLDKGLSTNSRSCIRWSVGQGTAESGTYTRDSLKPVSIVVDTGTLTDDGVIIVVDEGSQNSYLAGYGWASIPGSSDFIEFTFNDGDMTSISSQGGAVVVDSGGGETDGVLNVIGVSNVGGNSTQIKIKNRCGETRTIAYHIEYFVWGYAT